LIVIHSFAPSEETNEPVSISDNTVLLATTVAS
jgi:hypothetical protein